jgi:hypothetical protein
MHHVGLHADDPGQPGGRADGDGQGRQDQGLPAGGARDGQQLERHREHEDQPDAEQELRDGVQDAGRGGEEEQQPRPPPLVRQRSGQHSERDREDHGEDQGHADQFGCLGQAGRDDLLDGLAGHDGAAQVAGEHVMPVIQVLDD